MDRRLQRKSGIWQRLKRLRDSLPGLVVESLLITFGVLLAFAVDNWKSENRLKRDTLLVLENLKSEVIGNRGLVLEWLSYHDSLSHKLPVLIGGSRNQALINRIDQAALGEVYPEPVISYLLQNTAWQTAHSAQVIRNFKYSTTFNLTHCYRYQEEIEETRALVFAKMHEVTPIGRVEEQLKVIIDLFQQLSKQEHYLLGAYRDALIAIDQELVAGKA